MAEFNLYSDGTLEATEDEYRRGLSKVLKDDWLTGTFTVAKYPLLRAIDNAADADGTFVAFAADVAPYGIDQFAMRFKYDEPGLNQDKQDKMRLLMDIAVRNGGIVKNATIGKIYITARDATAFADQAETALARGT